MPDHEPTTHVACGEPELSEELRDALTLLRDRSDDDEFRTLVDDVLAGRRGLLDAAGTAAFAQAVFAPLAQEFQGMHPCGLPDGAGACEPCGGCADVCARDATDPPR